jgi:hypothetical protein
MKRSISRRDVIAQMYSLHRCFDWAIASRVRILHGDLEGRTAGAAD